MPRFTVTICEGATQFEFTARGPDTATVYNDIRRLFPTADHIVIDDKD